MALKTRTVYVLLASLLLLSACVQFTHAPQHLAMSHAIAYKAEQWAVVNDVGSNENMSIGVNLNALIETHLRSRGVNLIATAVSSRTQAMDASYANGNARYIVSNKLLQWQEANGKSTRPSVHIELSLYDRQTNTVVWKNSRLKQGARRATPFSVSNDVVAGLVSQIALREGRDPAVTTLNYAVKEMASASNSDKLRAPVSTALRSPATSVLDQPIVTRSTAQKSIALFYAAEPPVNALAQFDRVVLEPDNVDAQQLMQIKKSGAAAYAYISVGEVGPHRGYAKQIKNAWVLGENTTWNSKVLDLSNADVRAFLLQRVQTLFAQGYDGLFLDTMDSYQLYASTALEINTQEAALAELIQQMVAQNAGIKLIANRGFELLPSIAPYLEAVAAESLFSSWDNTAQRYVEVNEQDRLWLKNQLLNAVNQYKLEAISIDYVAPENRSYAREISQSIAKLGITPWVSTPGFDYLGVGLQEVIPRKILAVFDSREQGQVQDSAVHKLLAMPLEYYGYTAQYLDLATQSLPTQQLKGVYAGIVSWSLSSFNKPGYNEWVVKQMQVGIPVAAFNSAGFELTEELSTLTGLTQGKAIDANSVTVAYQDALIGYERAFPQRIDSLAFTGNSVGASNTVHLSVVDKNNAQADLVVTGTWGGISAYPANVVSDVDRTNQWITDPFKFLKTALQLEVLPMPDVTTENGKRLWMAHIDGDALPSWAEMPGRRLGAEVIQSEILNKYRMPHSISIVEAEMTSIKAYADRRARMFNVAKSIFKDPLVEIATHTFSHPYHWSKVINHKTSGKFNLPVQNYRYNPEREIAGSVKFIDKHLAPAGKSTALVLWSGNALPGEDALAEAAKLGLPNLNGAYTAIASANPSLSLISPMLVPVGPYIQAYAPIMNENVYTNDWTGPFDGYRRVIETLEMTDKPKRIKPLSIYYHFYAGTKAASLKSLEDVYDWSMQQDVMPVYASYYARKVPAFTKVGLSRYLDGRLKLTALGDIRSIRWLGGDKSVDVAQSSGLIGYKQLHDGLYLHTNGADTVTFRPATSSKQAPYIVSANGVVSHWDAQGNQIALRVQGHVPVELELGGHSVSLCALVANGKRYSGKVTERGTLLFNFLRKDTGHALLNCQA